MLTSKTWFNNATSNNVATTIQYDSWDCTTNSRIYIFSFYHYTNTTDTIHRNILAYFRWQFANSHILYIFRVGSKRNKKRHVYCFCSASLLIIRGISTSQIPLCDGFIWWCTGVGANPGVILHQSFWANPYKTLFHFLKRDDTANIHSHNNNDAYNDIFIYYSSIWWYEFATILHFRSIEVRLVFTYLTGVEKIFDELIKLNKLKLIFRWN